MIIKNIMQTKRIENGRYMGNIDVPGSAKTMAVGERWFINPRQVNLRSVRNAMSLLNTRTDMFFSVNCPGYTDPCITITRLK